MIFVLFVWPVGGSASHTGVAARSTDPVRELHALVNRHRMAVGCEALRWHGPSARVAEDHSRDMETRDYFAHVTPEGRGLAERLLAGGITWHGAIAENLARSPAGPESVLAMWLDSPPHRAAIETCSFTDQGIGRFRDLWTQVLIEDARAGGSGTESY